MVRNFRHALADMLEAMDGIQDAIRGRTLSDYRNEWLLRHAIQRGIEIISEASRSLPEEVRALRPEIPWQNVRDIGNVLRHEYHGLSDPIIWRVVVDELPHLRVAVDAIFAEIDQT